MKQAQCPATLYFPELLIPSDYCFGKALQIHKSDVLDVHSTLRHL